MDESLGPRYRRSVQARITQWANKNPWHRVYLGAGMTLASILLVVTPGTFVTPTHSRTYILVGGWVGVVVFGTLTLVLAVKALRSRNR